jgi:hypothetical protein
VLVEYSVVPAVSATPDVAAKETPKLREIRPRVSSVAVRAPDMCFAPMDPNLSGPPRIVLSAECAPWIGELERALASAGYRVLSWDALMQVEHQQSLTTYAAAERLGADVVFVFAQLDVADVDFASKPIDSLRNFAADERGDVVGPAVLDAATERDLASRVDKILGSGPWDRAAGLKSTIDGSAVLPETGEVVWLFRRVAMTPVGPPLGLRLLFARYGQGPWKAVAPESSAAPTSHLPAAPESLPQGRDEADGRAATATERSRLVRAAAAEFVRAFGGSSP